MFLTNSRIELLLQTPETLSPRWEWYYDNSYFLLPHVIWRILIGQNRTENGVNTLLNQKPGTTWAIVFATV